MAHHKKRHKHRKRVKTPGASPGTLVFEGEQRTERGSLRLLRYTPDQLEDLHDVALEDIRAWKERPGCLWLVCTGLHDIPLIQSIGDIFSIDPLTLEDLLNTRLRPKFEQFPGYAFLSVKHFFRNPEADLVESEQISIVLGDSFVISFEERPTDLFMPVFRRLTSPTGRLRKLKADYLACILLDSVIDNYLPVVDEMHERLDHIEDQIILDPVPNAVQTLHGRKREITLLLRGIYPLREILLFMARDDDSPFHEATEIYLRDSYDHVLEVVDGLESARETATALIDTHLSLMTSRTNEVIRFLTIVTSIFVPLTFITSIYGMNFRYMPELEWSYGYPAVMLCMLVLFVGFGVYCRKRGWL